MTMTEYSVQYVLPVDNPEKKVLVTKRKGCYSFEVPVNHPEAHSMGFMDLLAAAELSGLLGLSTDLNNTEENSKTLVAIRRVKKSLTPGKVSD